jgi:hypothetical protein
MTPDECRTALTSLDLTQSGAARLMAALNDIEQAAESDKPPTVTVLAER